MDKEFQPSRRLGRTAVIQHMYSPGNKQRRGRTCSGAELRCFIYLFYSQLDPVTRNTVDPKSWRRSWLKSPKLMRVHHLVKKMQTGINGINNKKLRTQKVKTAVQQMQLSGVTHFGHIRLDMKDAYRLFRRTTRVGAVIWTVSRDCSIRYRLTVCSDNVFTQTHTQTDCSDASPH